MLPEHLILALELAVSLSELGNLVLERGDLGLCSLRAGFRGVLVAEQASRDVPFAIVGALDLFGVCSSVSLNSR